MAQFVSPYWHPAVATDVALFTLRQGELHLLCVKRKDDGAWALPGGFMQQGENLDQCAARELKEETGIEVPYLRHFANYSEPDRDPREQVISIAYVAIHPSGKLRLKADTDVSDVNWFKVRDLPLLAFDHNKIAADAQQHLTGLVETNPEMAFAFLPASFTLSELQQTFEAIAGDKYAPHNKRNFRLWAERFGGIGLVVETGDVRTGAHRPAKLYEPNPKLF